MKHRRALLLALGMLALPWTAPGSATHQKPGDVPIARAMKGRAMATLEGQELLVAGAVATESDVTVARVPPRIDFVPVGALEPWGQGAWSTWGELLVAANGKVYFGAGDHGGYDARCYLLEYDPQARQLRTVVDVWKALGLGPGDFGEGKIHGRVDQGADGNLYFATYWGLPYTPEQLPTGWPGSRIFRYDPRTDEVECLGAPFAGETWPMTALDPVRGNMFLVGLHDNVMCYNVFQRRMLYGGYPPRDWRWFARSTMIDTRTGIFYGSARSINATERRQGKHTAAIIQYDPATNRFAMTSALLPDNPVTGFKQDEWRAYTRHHDADGAYYGCTDQGVLFKFFPSEERIESLGVNWGAGMYCTALALSPKGRYLYYTVDVHGGAGAQGAPVVQFDIHTRAKKVLAFLQPTFKRRFSYNTGGPFGTQLSSDGATLFMSWNGRFTRHKDEGFGDVSLIVVHIPAEERIE